MTCCTWGVIYKVCCTTTKIKCIASLILSWEIWIRRLVSSTVVTIVQLVTTYLGWVLNVQYSLSSKDLHLYRMTLFHVHTLCPIKHVSSCRVGEIPPPNTSSKPWHCSSQLGIVGLMGRKKANLACQWGGFIAINVFNKAAMLWLVLLLIVIGCIQVISKNCFCDTIDNAAIIKDVTLDNRIYSKKNKVHCLTHWKMMKKDRASCIKNVSERSSASFIVLFF